SLLVPLQPYWTLPLLAIAAAACSASHAVRADMRANLPRGSSRTAFCCILLTASFAVSGPSMVYDSGLYHYPLMRWMAEFGVAPGSALLHFRYGFSSSWLATAAAVDFGPWQGRAAAVTGGLAYA